jgi:uncharacterized small protein (DUF1192 family)
MCALADLFAIHQHLEQHPKALQLYTPALSEIYAETVLAGRLVKDMDEYLNTRVLDTTNQQNMNKLLTRDKTQLLKQVVQMSEQISLLRGEILRIEAQAVNQSENLQLVGGLVNQAKEQKQTLKQLNIKATSSLPACATAVSHSIY